MQGRFLLCFFLLFTGVCFADIPKDVLEATKFPLQKKRLRIGVLCAHPKELGTLDRHMKKTKTEEAGLRVYQRGRLWGVDTVIAVAKVGKVAAAITAAHMIDKYHIDALVFLGVAGAVSPELSRGDIVVAERLLQHDVDCRPIAPQYVIHLLGKGQFQTDSLLTFFAEKAAKAFWEKDAWELIGEKKRKERNLGSGKTYKGLVITGDQFITQESHLASLQKSLPEALCVEMEGAAVAQVCHAYKVPFCVVRTISDSANSSAAVDFQTFVQDVAATCSQGVLQRIYTQMQDVRKSEKKS